MRVDHATDPPSCGPNGTYPEEKRGEAETESSRQCHRRGPLSAGTRERAPGRFHKVDPSSSLARVWENVDVRTIGLKRNDVGATIEGY
jgi:hypothetical protein